MEPASSEEGREPVAQPTQAKRAINNAGTHLRISRPPVETLRVRHEAKTAQPPIGRAVQTHNAGFSPAYFFGGSVARAAFIQSLTDLTRPWSPTKKLLEFLFALRRLGQENARI
jgi:hypothetical protein